jgi:uncharacterized membrane protein (UPF0127 family)
MKTNPRFTLYVVTSLTILCVCTGSMLPVQARSDQTAQGGEALRAVRIRIGATIVNASHADTIISRREGLLGWDSITYEQGMLLDFPIEGSYAIHMQGMKFPIDAVWIDKDKTIRYIYRDIQPNSGIAYPSLFKCRYCLELKAGFCKKFNVAVGQKIELGVK